MGIIEVNNIAFTYTNKAPNVFTDVNISINKGESIAIVGQNGAGKTTMVKTLNGLLKPTSGDVFINDMNTKDYTTAELSRIVGYVFQNPDDQIFNDTVFDELAFGLKKLGVTEEKYERIIYEVSDICELTKYLDTNPYDLPYSIRKFVAIASIIVMDTEVVILDEPTAGQDMKGMIVIERIINYLIKNNKTVITITHDMEFTVKNFSRVIVMSQGKKLADSCPKDIFWNQNLLKKAQLQQPYISRVARKSNINSKAINISQLSEDLLNKIKNGGK